MKNEKQDTESHELTAKKSDFAEWYLQVVKVAGIADQRYPIKGCDILMPHGADTLRRMTNCLEDLLRKNGNKEVLFPMFIPESFFKKESHHIKGFEEDVFHVTHAGKNKLEENLIIRPTSETAMYPMFSLWIRSYNDLPLKIFQTVSVFRYETKMTKPLLRVREVMFFNESHTAHKDWEHAEKEVAAAMNIYTKHFSENLALPTILSKRPEWDKFPGAVYTMAFDTIMPDSCLLQIGTVHNLGENFAKPFNIMYTDEHGEKKYVNQTCYGISLRALAAVIGVHGDDKGLVLPPKIAPTQAVIIPIIFEKHKDKVMHAAHTLKEQLEHHGIRVHLDDRDQSPGSKYFDWEIQGIPIRIELGPKEVDKAQLKLVRRDNSEKIMIAEKNAAEFISNLLKNIQTDMLKKAEKIMCEKICTTESIQELAEVIKDKKIAQAAWCGSMDCAGDMEKHADAPFIAYIELPVDKHNSKCLQCNKHAMHLGIFGKKY